MEVDIKSLLEARALALMNGVSQLPPIEHDMNRMRPASAADLRTPGPRVQMKASSFTRQPVPHHPVPPVCYVPQFGANGVFAGWGLYPVPCFLPPPPQYAALLQYQPAQQASTVLCDDLKLPQSTIPINSKCPFEDHGNFSASPWVESSDKFNSWGKTPPPSLASSTSSFAPPGERLRRSSDYSGVPAETKELTLYALVETLLKLREDSTSEFIIGSVPEADVAAVNFTASNMAADQLSDCSLGESELAANLCQEDEEAYYRSCPCANDDTPDNNLCGSRCSTAAGMSRISFCEEEEEDDDDDEVVDDDDDDDLTMSKVYKKSPGRPSICCKPTASSAGLGFVPRPPQRKSQVL
eukprot:Blabericola_migrator_1__6346@NODE_31_length_18777_cov_137_037787_g27_i0_p5_GENE_NODE_31_length_18777_cov_137_037787_g27_i0NODE_31_length_18777_cov_137_037787_g27_i0_p5_ORF_typecomplete_len354_score38_39PBP1_TM/PF14812_6/0_34CENPB_dimeris/PF09026_10/5_3_NODE_31_length_18777_cov_137_037787_g27_i08701931